jgi:hypothetical protein
LGRVDADPADLKAFFRAIGIADLAERGDDFVEYYAWVHKHAPHKYDDGADFHQHERSQDGPWTKQECPLVAQWLDANERALALATEASKRPRYYVPRISHRDPHMLTWWLPIYHYETAGVEYITRGLVARAMLRLGEGNIDLAWEDLQTVHRLARLLGQGKSLIDGRQAYVMALQALHGQQRIGELGRLTPQQVKKFRADLDSLSPIPPIMQFGLTERFAYLDLVCYSACHGVPKGVLEDSPIMTELVNRITKEMEKTSQGRPVTVTREPEPTEQSLRAAIILEGVRKGQIDWNAALKHGNKIYDRLEAAGRKTELRERHKAVVAADTDIQDAYSATTKPLEALADEFSKTHEVRPSRDLVDRLLAWEYFRETSFGPATFLQEQVENRAIIEGLLTGTVLALGAYRTEHGRYPERLQDLVPKYLDRVPKDPFFDGDMRFSDGNMFYRRLTDGYLLYSVGPNGKDDGGPPLEVGSGNTSDDVGIRFPEEGKRGQAHIMGNLGQTRRQSVGATPRISHMVPGICVCPLSST